MVETRAHKYQSGDAATRSATHKAAPKGAAAGKSETVAGGLGTAKREPAAAPAPGHGAAQPAGAATDTIEQGLIYFFFRPKVEHETAQGMADVQRAYVVLRPTDEALHGARCRLLLVPRKTFAGAGGRLLALVQEPAATVAEVRAHLAASTYETKSLGERHLPPARPICEGVYVLSRTAQGAARTELSYKITVPAQPSAVERDFAIEHAGRFVVSARNPLNEPPAGMAMAMPAPHYPSALQDKFNNHRWTALTPEHLGYKNTQVLFIATKHGLDALADEPYADILRLDNENHSRLASEAAAAPSPGVAAALDGLTAVGGAGGSTWD
ncbi:uncharacterized protein V1510DRAFT_322565 [Dipodascopsis tothii]|uniref:uncharacterized protein n=1 Tax=Dipodascopsis tothii TaxID=44089 RepID=UPI0034CD0A14